MSYRLLITTSCRTNDSVAISTQVVEYELERIADQVFLEINSAYGSTSDFPKLKIEATRLYPKGK